MVGSAIQVIINILAVNMQVHVMINDPTCNHHNFFKLTDQNFTMHDCMHV